MSIRMIGIDHQTADVDIRALFAYTKKNAAFAFEKWKKYPGILGSVLISTCNRMEWWVSVDDDWSESLYELLCEDKKLDADKYRNCYVERRDQDAITHLFYLTSGLKSMILAEDQILSQVKDAISWSRENYAADNVLEVLFRKAITAGKRIKTEVVFKRGNQTAIDRAVELLLAQQVDFARLKCLVIGNGEMGKLAAQCLSRHQADVTVTVRQYKSGQVEIPCGCKRINYGDRSKMINDVDLIVSATASPNFTITTQLLNERNREKPLICIDLAVPRDIEAEVGQMESVQLYTIDDFKSDQIEEDDNKQAYLRASDILNEEMQEFDHWYSGIDQIPRINALKVSAAKDLSLRLQKIISKLPISSIEKEQLAGDIESAEVKVINKMLFGLKAELTPKEFMNCLDGLEHIYGK